MSEKQAKTVTDETEISTTELAMVLGVTARRVQQLTQDGTFVTVKRGRFLLADNVQRYITYISGNSMSEEDKNLEKARKMADVKIKHSKATVAALEADELRGKMHRSEDVAIITADLVMNIRAMLMALPGRLAVDVSNAASAAECATIIKNGAYDVMEELARYRYDATKYDDRMRERRDWATKEEPETDDYG